MKTTLAGAVLIAALAACGGGGSVPVASPTATQTALHAQAVGTIPAMTYQLVISPANGQLTDSGEAFTLSAPVPVYDIGSVDTVSFTFSANPYGLPVAVQVGTTATANDETIALPFHAPYINGKMNIVCGMDAINSATYPAHIGPAGAYNIDYFVCAGNPFA